MDSDTSEDEFQELLAGDGETSDEDELVQTKACKGKTMKKRKHKGKESTLGKVKSNYYISNKNNVQAGKKRTQGDVIVN